MAAWRAYTHDTGKPCRHIHCPNMVQFRLVNPVNCMFLESEKKKTENSEETYADRLVTTNDDPASPHLFWLNEFELHATTGPGNKVCIARIIQESYQKLPKLQRATSLIGGTVTEHTAALLFHLT